MTTPAMRQSLGEASGRWRWIEGYEAIQEETESQVSGTHTLEDARKEYL